MPRVFDLAHGRSGDKGDICNVGIIARSPEAYEVLSRQLTADRVKQHFGELVTGRVDRYEMPNIHALNFVLNGGSGRRRHPVAALRRPGQGHVRVAAAHGARPRGMNAR